MSGKTSRNKGHGFERSIAQMFRDMGWTKCKTSRYESKMLDDACVDLTNTNPFQIQCKNVERLGNLHTELSKMPKGSNYNLVFHKRSRQGTIVAMSLDDFKEILQMLINNQIIKP